MSRGGVVRRAANSSAALRRRLAVTVAPEGAGRSPFPSCRARVAERHLIRKRRHDDVRLHPVQRAQRAPRTLGLGRDGRGGRFRLRGHLRPLPSMARQPHRQPVRLDRARRGRGADRADPSGHAGHLSDHPLPPGDHRAGRRDGRGAERRSVHPGRRRGREPQRARRRPGLATGRHPPGDAGGGRRGDAGAVAGRVGDLPGQAHHRRRRPPVHAARPAARGADRRERPGGDVAGRHRRRRPRGDRTGRGADLGFRARRRGRQADARAGGAELRHRRGEGAPARHALQVSASAGGR